MNPFATIEKIKYAYSITNDIDKIKKILLTKFSKEIKDNTSNNNIIKEFYLDSIWCS